MSSEHRDVIYQWLEAIQHSYLDVDPYGPQVTKFPALSPAVTEALFEKMAALDHETLSVDGFKMYRQFFLSVNGRQRKLRKIGETEFRVCDFGLVGLDMFWGVALSSKNTNVAKMALAFLRNVYENVARKLEGEAYEKRTQFLQHLLDCVFREKDVLRGESDPQQKDFAREKVNRAISLLVSILSKDNRTRPSSEIHELRAKEAIYRMDQAKKPATADADADAISSAMESLSADPKPAENKDPSPSSSSSPSAPRPGDVIESTYLNELFDLMTIAEMRDSVWELIMILPTNQKCFDAVFSLEKEGDGRFLFVKQIEDAVAEEFIFRMLYLMQVIRVLLEDAEWVGRFIAAGGLNYLVQVFSNRDLLTDANGKYGKQTMSHLVDTMNFLFSSGRVEQDKLIGCLSTNFILRLMGQISELAVRPPELSAQTSDVLKIDEPEAARGASVKKGTRIANCYYSSKKIVLSFVITGGHYRVAVYCVDYNTDKRTQSMIAWLGDDPSVANDPENGRHPNAVVFKNPEFHSGQWAVWDVHGEGKFNITMQAIDGPNWTFSALLLDKSPDLDAPPSTLPTLLFVDNETQGKWRGVYGSCGGALFGKRDFIVPPQPGMVAPTLVSWEAPGVDKYEWVDALTIDPRGMQPAPLPDELALPVDDESLFEPLPTLPDVKRMNLGDSVAARSTETGRSLLGMLVASSLSREDLLSAVTEYKDLKVWLFTCLVHCTDAKLREGVVDGISDLCDKSAASTTHFLRLLLDYLPEVELAATAAASAAAAAGDGEKEDSPSSKSFSEYFSLLLSLLEKCESVDEKEFFSQVYSKMRSHVTLEDDDKQSVDTILVGYLDLIIFFVQRNPSLLSGVDIAQDIFHDCLFGVQETRHSPKIPKCRSKTSRDKAVQLILIAAKGSPSVHEDVVRLLSLLLDKSSLPVDWSIDIFEKSSEEKTSRTHYVGLKNQGCTCYLNSLIQQLFIIPSLRNDILNVKLDGDKSSVMYQLQSLFAYMQESRAKFVDTINFCKTVKLMGEPIVMSRQEDANEFFNSLADQVEPFLKGKSQEHLFRDTFGGTLLSQIISLECPHQSNSPQDFLTISIKVQSKRDIYESLDFYVQADMLDGNNKWKCEACDKHVTAKKRACVQHLPNTLILHLIRFEFDYQTFQEVKVNDRFEFPNHLNMKAYTREGIAELEGEAVEDEAVRPDDYYEYDLVGVLVHSGTAHSGHYYSYIRERVPPDGGEPKWFEFNDRDVSPFSPESIPAQCFGGKYSESYKSDKSYSAYMLFYERKNTYAAGKYVSEPLHMGSVALDVSQEKTVEPTILDTIWRDSIAKAQQKQLMTSTTLNFFWSVVELLPPLAPVETYTSEIDRSSFPVQAVLMATRFLFDVVAHCADNLNVVKKFQLLASLYRSHVPLSTWLLEQMTEPDNTWMKNILLHCPEVDTRVAAAELVSQCIGLVAPYEHDFYFDVVAPPIVEVDSSDKGKEEDSTSSAEKKAAAPSPGKAKSVVVRFVNAITTLLTASADKAAPKIQQMLYVLLQFGKVGILERKILMAKNAVNDLVALFDSHRFSLTQTSSNQPTQTSARFSDLIELLAVLMVGCDNPKHEPHRGQEGFPAATGMELDPESLKKVFEKTFLTNVLRQPHLIDPLTPILLHWSWGQPDYSAITVKSICTILDGVYNPPAREPYYQLLYKLVSLQDPEHVYRVNTLMQNLV
jgi:ubiquitin C-terminal hydrolase